MAGPNILWIMTDQQRADTLGCYAETVCRAPNLVGLAEQSTRFDSAYTVCPVCAPARTSMMTGVYPHTHRMWNNNDMFQWAVRDIDPSVGMSSERLVEAGYRCGWTGKWHCGRQRVPSTVGFEGMDLPDYGQMYDNAYYQDYLRSRGLARPEWTDYVDPNTRYLGGLMTGPVEASPTYFHGEHALGLLEDFSRGFDRSGRPFCQVVSFFGPHHACFIPEPYASMIDPASVELPGGFEDDLSGKPAYQRRFRDALGQPHLPEEVWQKAVAKYYGFVSLIDDQIGRLLGALEDLGRAGDTTVLFTTDHGDTMGSRGGGFDKGYWPYEEVYRIPLLIRRAGSTTGQGCGRLVSNMDLPATVLDLAGLDVPDHYHSRSLCPLLDDPAADWTDELVCEFHGNQYLFTQRLIRWGHFKYVFTPSNDDELYDLSADPHEQFNRIAEPTYQEVVAEGRRRLVAAMKASQDPLAARAERFLPL